MNNKDLRISIKGVVVDAGHGGIDPGAVNGNVKEKDFNLKAANYMAQRLNELGIPSTLTRDIDTTLTRDERISEALNAYGKNDNVILISNHINAGGGEGAEVVYALRNNDNLASSILENIGLQGQLTRKVYQRRLPENSSKDYYYIIRETNPLESILVEYGFIDNSKDLNKLENNLLDYVEGAVKAIAQYAGVPYVYPTGEKENVYTVQSGDTLYSIANKLSTTVNALKDANNLVSNILTIGQVLAIPITSVITTPTGDNLIYVVQSGDSLYSIAQKYNTTVNDIITLNQLGSTTLSIGQQLLIPSLEIEETEYYTVQSGDTLYSIANKFNIPINKLKELNNLTTDILTIGQQLLIKESDALDEIPEVPEIEETEQVLKYVVQNGDSLYSIAKQYNVSIDELKNYNNLTSNLLKIGQILLIPETTEYINYYVQSGDSLYKIANKYNTTVDAIKTANNLTNNLLQIGQLLIIPQ